MLQGLGEKAKELCVSKSARSYLKYYATRSLKDF
jgi:hypothetical protein